jgi:hypothetical protein
MKQNPADLTIKITLRREAKSATPVLLPDVPEDEGGEEEPILLTDTDKVHYDEEPPMITQLPRSVRK